MLAGCDWPGFESNSAHTELIGINRQGKSLSSGSIFFSFHKVREIRAPISRGLEDNTLKRLIFPEVPCKLYGTYKILSLKKLS